MSGGWLRLAGRGVLGYAVGVGLDVFALSFIGAGHGDYALAHVSLALLPVLWLLGAGAVFTLLVVGPWWAALYAILPALASRPRTGALIAVLGLQAHLLVMPLLAYGRLPVAGLLHGACVVAGLALLLWLCRSRAG